MMLNYMHDYHELNAGFQSILNKEGKLFNNWNSNLIYCYANIFYGKELQILIQKEVTWSESDLTNEIKTNYLQQVILSML